MGEAGGRNGRAVARAGLLLLAALLTAGCVEQFRTHGYMPPAAEIAALEPGRDTRETVVAALGRPGASGLLTDTSFYYVQSRFRLYGALAPREIDRQVLVLGFDAGGTLRNIERFGLEDGQVVTLSRRVTDDNLRDTTFLRQLFGNIGRLDAAGLIGEE